MNDEQRDPEIERAIANWDFDDALQTYSTVWLSAEQLEKVAIEAIAGSAKSSGIVAVVFAAASVEAMLNEALHLLGDTDRDVSTRRMLHFAAIVENEQRGTRTWGIWDKVRAMASAHFDTKDPDIWLSEPFREFGVLINLRNAIMHLKPELLIVVVDRGDETYSRSEPAASRLFTQVCTLAGVDSNSTDGRHVPLVTLAMDKRVGQWAIQVARGTINALRAWFDAADVHGSFNFNEDA
jgi:hypothetical protein